MTNIKEFWRKDFSIDKAQKDLREIKEVFDANNTEFFLLFGTCLGAVRNKNIIEWDYDIDIGVLDHTSKSKIAVKLVEHGFKVTQFPNYWLSIKRIRNDIIWFIRRRDKIVCIGQKNQESITIPARFFNDLVKVKIGNDEYLAPCHTEEYLNVVYGNNWREINKTQMGAGRT